MTFENRQWSQVFQSLEEDDLKVLPEERYSVRKEAGRGGAKIVCKAIDNHSGREVAYIKPISDDESKRDLFMREARITAYLQHPNILPVYDVSGEDSTYFVCKLLRGKTLSDIRPKQLTKNEKISLFKKICEALEYAHSRGVLHLDLKPDNIRLDKYGEVLVIDWGLAEIFCTEGVESPLDNPMISDQESSATDYTSLGTPGYMSPEQIYGSKVGVQTDIFSLGALLYFMFHMKAPFRGEDVDQVFDETLTGRFEFKSDELSTGLKSIISKCLLLNAGDRYKDVSELIADLDAIENNYVPEAEKASFFRHIQMLYKRNRLISNLLILFLTAFIVLNARYINQLNSSKTEAVAAKDKAEKYLNETLESQKKNEQLTKQLSPRYYIQAKRHWDFFRISQAMKDCDIALKLNPANKDANNLKAKLLYVTGKYKEAHEVLKKAHAVAEFRSILNRLIRSNDPIKIILSNNNPKLREQLMRVLLDQFRQTGNIDHLKRVIMMENSKIKKLNISFKNGTLDLSDNPELDNIHFLGGITFQSLSLARTSVDDLEAIHYKNINTLNLSETEVSELYSLKGVQINKLALGKTNVPSLSDLVRVDIKELIVVQDRYIKFPASLLSRLRKLTMINPKTVFLQPTDKPSLEGIDISRANLRNPDILLNYTELKVLKVNRKSFPKNILNQLVKRGVKVN